MKLALLNLTILLSLQACGDVNELKNKLASRQSRNLPIIEIKNDKKPQYAKSYLKKVAYREAIINNLNPDKFIKQLHVESGFNPYAVGQAKEKEIGVGQIKPSTAKENCLLNKSDLFHPIKNIQCAARYLHNLKTKYKSEIKAKRYYNGGGNCVNGQCPQVEIYLKKIGY